jgi:hypothetical protein
LAARLANTPVFCFQKNKGTDITVNFISYDWLMFA